mmetsp:Transcript_21032/g.62774  ORF Transcript_21032/g.62774 Transcript_21032/m.62774 type:complete len:721 (+) Transcript_21032:1013-3175(+)
MTVATSLFRAKTSSADGSERSSGGSPRLAHHRRGSLAADTKKTVTLREAKTAPQPTAAEGERPSSELFTRRYSARRQSKNKTVISKLLALEAKDHKRQSTRRWRLRSASDGVRVFSEEIMAPAPSLAQRALVVFWGAVVFAIVWSLAVTASLGTYAAVAGLRTSSPALDIFLVFAACGVVGGAVAAVVVTSVARGVDAFAACAGEVWTRTGRVRADMHLRASPEGAFAFVSADGALRDEWDRWYDSSQTRTFDAHTALVDTVEIAPSWSFARALAPLPRVSRAIRFWSRDGDGSYTIVASDAAGTEEGSALESPYAKVGVRVTTMEDLFVIRPAATDGGAIATRVADADYGLLLGFVPRTSRLGVAWAADRLRDGMVGLRAACDQIIDDAAVRNDEKRCHFSYGAKELHRASCRFCDERAFEEVPPPPLASPERVVPGHATAGGLNRVFTQGASRRLVGKTPFAEVFGSGSPGCLERFDASKPADKWGSYDEPTGSGFMVRGPHYLEDRKKVASAGALCELAGVEVLKDASHPLLRLGERPRGVVSRLVAPDRLVLVINFVLPTPSHYVSLAAFYVCPAANPLANTSKQRERLDAFVSSMTDAQRNDVLKIIPKLVEGPWVARHAVGQKPALLGHKITTEYHSGEGWFEIDIDVSTSSAATGALRILKSASAGVVMDLAFTLEAQTAEDLPEQVMCTVSFQHFVLDVAASPKIREASEDN